jgi:AcrR family transcriptional regulator
MSTRPTTKDALMKAVAKTVRAASSRGRKADVNTEETILKTAEELFATFGYDAVSTKQLASCSGVTIGALYHYFPSKEALYESVRKNIFDRRSVDLGSLFKETDGVEDKMSRLLSRFIDNLVSDKNYGLFLQRELLNPDTKATERLIDRYFKGTYEEFRRLLTELVPSANQDIAFASLLSLVMGFTNLRGIYTVAPDIEEFVNSPDNIASHIIKLMKSGLT